MTETYEPGRAFRNNSTGTFFVKLQGGKWLVAGKFGWHVTPEGLPEREIRAPFWEELISAQDCLSFPWKPVSSRLDSSANVPQEAKDALQRSFGEGI